MNTLAPIDIVVAHLVVALFYRCKHSLKTPSCSVVRLMPANLQGLNNVPCVLETHIYVNLVIMF